jgi:hypothetical protein
VLEPGYVLVTGGTSDASVDVQAHAESFLYDVATGHWSTIASLPVTTMNTHARMDAIVLDDGRVLVAGGWRHNWHLDATGNEVVDVDAILTDAFLFTLDRADPGKSTWSTTGSMSAPRATAAVVKLRDGRVLHVGGIENPSFESSATGDVYDPASEQWTPTPDMPSTATDDDPWTGYSDATNPDDNAGSRWQHAAALLASGEVLVAGGTVFNGPSGGFVIRRSALVYDPRCNAWTEVAPMADRRTGARAIRLRGDDGGVLVIGSDFFGGDGIYDLRSTTIFEGHRWVPAAPLTTDTSVSIFDGGLIELRGTPIQIAGFDGATGNSGRVFAYEDDRK